VENKTKLTFAKQLFSFVAQTMTSETQLQYSELPGATELTKQHSARRWESKTRRSFLSRLRPSSSNPSVTSVEDSESTFSQDIICKSPLLSQRVSVSNVIPAEVEIVVQDADDNFTSSVDTFSSKPCAPTFEQRDESSSFRNSFRIATQTGKTAEMLEPFTRALNCLSCNRVDQAIKEIEEGLAVVDATSAYYWKLNALKAEVYARKGDARDSLELFEHVLEQPMNECTPAEFVSIYFSCGRLSRILKDYPKALEYHTHELLYRRAMSGNNLDVARTYHDLAYIAQYGLGDWSLAFDYYEQALHIEATLWQRLKVASNFHNSSFVDEQKRLEALQEASHRIQETRKAMGRIQFCLGFVAEGMRLSNHRFQID
jgi:tetratricopeptide (TPR) repeat protein